MLTIVQRGGATREKPPEVVRGFSSRLPWAWDGLVFAAPFNDSTRDSARDLVYNVAPSAASGMSWTRDNRGNPAAQLGTTSYVDYPDNPGHNKPSTSITVYARLLRLGATDTAGGIFVKRWGGSVPYLSWGLQMDDFTTEGVQGFIATSTSTYENLRGGYVLPTNLWVSVFMRWQSGKAPTLYVLGERGEILSAYTHVTTSGTIPYVAGEPIRLNATDVTSDNSNAAYSQAMVWSRVLTDTELQALVADPYGWYSPRRSTVITSSPYALPFGGGEMRSMGGMGGMY